MAVFLEYATVLYKLLNAYVTLRARQRIEIVFVYRNDTKMHSSPRSLRYVYGVMGHGGSDLDMLQFSASIQLHLLRYGPVDNVRMNSYSNCYRCLKEILLHVSMPGHLHRISAIYVILHHTFI